MKKQSLWRASLFTLCMLLAMQVAASAQEATGKIIGTIADQQGAVIPGAKVTATNTATQITRETTTDADGYFEITSLPIGTYQVTAEQSGFKKATAEQKLQINQSLRFDLKLEAGSVNETVDVSSGVATVETANPTIAQSVTDRPIVNLPLNGRNVLQLALTLPGVTEKNPDATTQAGTFNIGGGRSDSVTYLLDGGNNNNLLSNGVVYNPNPDAVAEFRILTSNYTAEYGRNGGGIVSVVTKSGGNEFHGSLFEFLRNDKLNANSFFNNRNGLPREILKRNQFGGTVGGPITIPRLVNGRDRFFFFVAYQGQRQVLNQTTASVTTFTPAELKGDFSHSGADGGPDRAVANYLLAHPFYQPNAALAAQAIIDPSRIDPVAQRYIAAGLIPTSSTGIITSQGGSSDNRDELTLKFDLNTRKQDRLSITLGQNKNPLLFPFGNTAANNPNVSGFPITTNVKAYFANIAYTSVFSPTLVNDFRFTAQRANQQQLVPAADLPTHIDLGITGITPDNPVGPTRLEFDKGLVLGFAPNGPTTLINNTFSWTDTVSWIKGKHSFKFGGSYSPYQNNTVFDFYVTGTYFFYGAAGGVHTGLTDDNGDPVYGAGNDFGNDFADFLLGLPDEYLQFGEAPSNIRSKSYYAFLQDEWKVRPNLTLSLGLRYEYDTPKKDTQGRSFSYIAGQQSTRFVNAPRGLVFPGDPGAPEGANFPDKNNFAPRVGFAYSPFQSGRTSLRGGFGVFYDILKGEDNLQFNGQAPFFGFADLFFDPRDPGTGAPNYLNRPFTATGSVNNFPSHPPASNIDFEEACGGACGGGGVFIVDPNLRTPYTYQYNLSLQQQLARNLIAEAAYVGSSSHGLTALVDRNPFILGTSQRVLNQPSGNRANAFSYFLEFRNASNATYNGMHLSLQKQSSETGPLGSTYFTLAYTWSHTIDDASGFRNRNSQVPTYNNEYFRASADYDVRHRVTFSGGWDLPFNRVWESGPNRLTGGWSLYPIYTYRTGFPLDVLARLSNARTTIGPSGAGDAALVRANLVGGGIITFDPHAAQTIDGRTGNFGFDPRNFTTAGLPSSAQARDNPALRTYGSVPRNAFRGPSRYNVDLAVAKVTQLWSETTDVEFRAEFFNLLNNPQFGNPSTNINSSLFGQVTTTFDPRIIQFALKFKF
jgi:outer membrane receptor protein involved in Fe transport